ncbi:MAG: type I-E CRISPR-associated protein Cse1/CasA [Lentilactobacillus diolivorans]|jgi:CRISPR system Cascade subunit CasA|nr:type I-E CRISPR-associated protein Cse1/CasA [Lentilactobacillus diolivorans]
MANSFNLTSDPWIKVIDRDSNQEKTVSMIELFENAQKYRQLAGEMRSQDLAVLRLLLSVLTTVYSRFDIKGDPYEWLKIDSNTLQASPDIDDDSESDIEEDLLGTWAKLYKSGRFSEIVTQYLQRYSNRFDFFGEKPFYQVTEADYDALVPEKKRVSAGKGTVAVKQINRQVSESGHTPSVFAPRSGELKNEIKLDELVRWIITYQNFTGVTDKTKIETKEKFSVSPGWLYKLNPVFADGQSLFQTLMLNLVLVNEEKEYSSQKPVWEYDSVLTYVSERKEQIMPTNLAELYTAWSRILHIEWDENDQPTIFSAGLPMFGHEDAFLEPMTVWKRDKKTNRYKPAVKGPQSLGKAMWRNFGQYVNVTQSDDVHDPGIVGWLRLLKRQELIPQDSLLTLASVTLISDGNAASQTPIAEVYDDMHINADVLFDKDTDKRIYWPQRIEEVITLTQQIGKDYWQFAADIGKIRNVDVRPFANQVSAEFYQRLNEPFREWLSGLTNQDDRDEKIIFWKKQLRKYVLDSARNVVNASAPRDVGGVLKDKGLVNIFTANNHLRYRIQADLDLKKG